MTEAERLLLLVVADMLLAMARNPCAPIVDTSRLAEARRALDNEAYAIVLAEIPDRPELRPPPEHRGKSLHWLDAGAGLVVIARYRDADGALPEWWELLECAESFCPTPADMAARGYRYLAPAEPPPACTLTVQSDWADFPFPRTSKENA